MQRPVVSGLDRKSESSHSCNLPKQRSHTSSSKVIGDVWDPMFFDTP